MTRSARASKRSLLSRHDPPDDSFGQIFLYTAAIWWSDMTYKTGRGKQVFIHYTFRWGNYLLSCGLYGALRRTLDCSYVKFSIWEPERMQKVRSTTSSLLLASDKRRGTERWKLKLESVLPCRRQSQITSSPPGAQTARHAYCLGETPHCNL